MRYSLVILPHPDTDPNCFDMVWLSHKLLKEVYLSAVLADFYTRAWEVRECVPHAGL